MAPQHTAAITGSVSRDAARLKSRWTSTAAASSTVSSQGLRIPVCSELRCLSKDRLPPRGALGLQSATINHNDLDTCASSSR